MVARRVLLVAALLLVGWLATSTLMGPRGLARLAEKKEELRTLERYRQELQQRIREKEKRIDALEHDPETQRLEIRKRLQAQEPGTVDFFYPPEELSKPATNR